MCLGGMLGMMEYASKTRVRIFVEDKYIDGDVDMFFKYFKNEFLDREVCLLKAVSIAGQPAIELHT